ncbi:MAG: radical SAM/SPASM domain-containing protein [Spirochaetota bacterium]
MLTYIVTFKCNARCIMCDSWKKTDHNDLSFDEILAIFKQMPRLDVVRLTGGEPFVRKDFPEIVDAARKILKPKLIHVTSNGFMNNNIVEFCENRNKTTPLFLLFSVDGMKDKHNHIRGTDIAWDRVTDCIKRLAPRRKALNVRIAVNQTIVDGEGISQYEMLNGYLRQFDINNNLVMAYDASATYDSGTSEKNIAPAQIGEFFTYGDFSKSEIENLFKKAERNLKTYPFIEQILKRYYFKGIKNRLLSGKPVPNPTCVALNAHMRLYPDGRVPVCQFHSASIGNLRTDSFHDVWYGRKASAFREWVSKCPGCWAECEILPNAVYSGDIFRHIV